MESKDRKPRPIDDVFNEIKKELGNEHLQNLDNETMPWEMLDELTRYLRRLGYVQSEIDRRIEEMMDPPEENRK